MAVTTPTTVGLLTEGDFVTTTLNGAISSGATSATIGTGLNIPATNGILQIDYDSTTAVGSDNGPETIKYASYTSGTGALTGLTRGADAYTTGVAHANGATVQAGLSTLHLNNLADVIENLAWTTWAPAVTGFSGSPTVNAARYFRLGKLVFGYLSFTGTSNATTKTAVLPVACETNIRVPMRATDNGGTPVAGLADTTAGSTTVTFYSTVGSGAWTASGTCLIEWLFCYEADS